MSNEDENDILKRLRDVRRKLQESLTDQSAGTERTEKTSNLELVDSQKEIEKQDRQKLIQNQMSPESTGPAGKPKLYKAASDEIPTKTKVKDKEFERNTGISRKRMAAVQRRVRSKMESRKSITIKQRLAMVVAISVAIMPLLATPSLAFATCSFDFSGINLSYLSPGKIRLFLPVTNPSFIPAKLGDISLELYDQYSDTTVSRLSTYLDGYINPYETQVLSLDLYLDPTNAGPWLQGILTNFKISLVIRNFKYNGMQVVSDITIPEVDLTSLLGDLLGSGIDLNSMLGSSEESAALGINKPGVPNDLFSANRLNSPMGSTAKNGKSASSISTPKSAQSDDVGFQLLNLGIGENDTEFAVSLDLAFSIPALDGFDLGPIRILELDAGIYGPTGPGAKTAEQYTNQIARLSTLVPGVDKIVTDFSDNKDLKGRVRNETYPVEVNLGSVCYAAARLQIFKDDLGGAKLHPSAKLNYSDAKAVEDFVGESIPEGGKYKYPMWYFLFNLLSNQGVDVQLRLNKLSLEIFGVKIENLNLDKNFLKPIKQTGLFDLDSLTSGFGVKTTGLLAMFQIVAQTVATGGMNAYKYSITRQSALEKPVNIDDLGSLFGGVQADDLLGSIKETIGTDDANLSLGLGITLENKIIDLHIGLQDLTLGIANDYTDDFGITSTRVFAQAVALSDRGTTDVYINGINSSTNVFLKLTLLTNKVYGPHVGQFLRDLLETYTLKGTAVLGIGKLVLFAQNYTFEGIKVALGLDALGIDLEDTLVGAVQDGINGLELGAYTSKEPESASIDFGSNILASPIVFLTSLMLGNPYVSALTGISVPNLSVSDNQGNALEPLQVPSSAQEIHIKTDDVSGGTKITLSLSDLEIKPDTIPIHVGIGYTYLEIQTNNTNNYGNWAPILGLTLADYIELGPEGSSLSLSASLTVFHKDGVLCSLLSSIFSNRTDSFFNLRVKGTLTLNLSGVYIPDIKLDLQVPELGISINLQGLIDGLTGASALIASTSAVVGPQKSLIQEQDQSWWDGDISKLPFASQDIDMDEIIQIGGFELVSMTENGWPDVNEGYVRVELKLQIKNMLMKLALFNTTIKISDLNDHYLAGVFLSKEQGKFSETNYVDLNSKVWEDVYIRLELKKSQYLQDWLNGILSKLYLDGKLYVSLGIEIFGCKIGPVILNTTLGTLLDTFGASSDLTTLIGSILPFNEKTIRDSPRASVDAMELLGNFGLGWVTSQKKPGAYSPIDNVGPCNYQDPMMTFIAGFILQPGFNMSIKNANLYLCDANIYKKIYNVAAESGNQYYAASEALKYSKIAGVGIDPVYANNTYAPNTEFAKVSSTVGVNQYNYNRIIDKKKPYIDTSNPNNATNTIKYAQKYYPENTTGMYASYQDLTGGSYLGTFALTQIKLSLYNISHGDLDTAYPKRYWRALGGPYFPVQVFGVEDGGYPDHRVVYNPNYSPIGNLFAGVGSVISNPAAILSKVTIAGNLTINLFSMDITLDASSPAIQSLIGSLTTTVLGQVTNQFKQAVDITGGNRDPYSANYERIVNAQKYYDDPSIPRLATDPTYSAFSTSEMELDMEAIIDDYGYYGIDTRNDHSFSPAMQGLSSDGNIHSMQEYRYMGTNINPWKKNYLTGANYVDPNYKPGLVEFGGSNEEVFVKDPYYEIYKKVMQNWADSKGYTYNPYFESENLSTWKSNKTGIYFDKIADSRNWALRWNFNKEDDIGPSRLATWGGIFIAPVVPAFELGVLSAFANAWFESGATTGLTCNEITPMGYIWINSSVFPQLKMGRDDRFHETNGQVYGENGMVGRTSNWAMANMRLFDCIGTKDFLGKFIGLDNDFNLPLSLILDVTVNASLFGYEIYNLALSGLGLGDLDIYKQRCEQSVISGETSNWDTISTNGTVISNPTAVEKPKWIPDGLLPNYKKSTWGIKFSTDTILDSLVNSLKNVGNIFRIVGGLLSGKLSMSLPGARLTVPLILPGWLTSLTGTVWINVEDDKPLTQTRLNNWGYGGATPDVDLSRLTKDENGNPVGWWTDLNPYWDTSPQEDRLSDTLGLNKNPYNIKGNYLSWNPETNTSSCGYNEVVTLPDLDIVIGIARIIPALGDLINQYLFGKERNYLWLTVLRDRGSLANLIQGGTPRGLNVNVLLLNAFGYKSFTSRITHQTMDGLELPTEPLTMNLWKMITDAL